MTECSEKPRLAVLVSGGGTNLQALMDHAARGNLSGEIVVVASDRSDARGLERARENGIPAHVVEYKAHMQCEIEDPLAVPLPIDLRELDRTQKILRDPDAAKRLLRLCRLVAAGEGNDRHSRPVTGRITFASRDTCGF